MKTDQFKLKYIEKKFQESERFLKLFIYAGPLTYIGFGVADYLKYPLYIKELMTVRILWGFIVLSTYWMIRKEPNLFKNQVCKLSWSLLGSMGIVYMLYLTDGPASPYYSGINLVAIFSLMFGTYDPKFFRWTLFLTYLPYYYLSFIQFDRFTDWREFMVLSVFNIGTILGIILTYHKREGDLHNIIEAELALEKEIINREKIIAKKTEEATQLHQLSSQFSPQVVQAIKNGSISIEKEVQRSRICAIFIDIVKSTERVTTLSENEVKTVIERFLDSCLTIFLKYDLTIDKFHGDGVLAYSNMPMAREDFIERTCMAALEVVSAIKSDKEFYLAHWRSELQVRVGIAVGFASVGFFGNKKYFKTFTAIGAPLPYASRLTSHAKPDQILIDHEIEKRLHMLGWITKSCGEVPLKGFEKDVHSIFELVSSPEAVVKDNSVRTCPKHVNSVLFIDTNSMGHFVFKCRDCEYEAAIDSSDLNQKTVFKQAA